MKYLPHEVTLQSKQELIKHHHKLNLPDAAAVTAAGASAAEGGSGFSAELSGSRSVGSLVTVTCHQRLVTGLPLVGPMLGDPEVVERLVIRVESLGG